MCRSSFIQPFLLCLNILSIPILEGEIGYENIWLYFFATAKEIEQGISCTLSLKCQENMHGKASKDPWALEVCSRFLVFWLQCLRFLGWREDLPSSYHGVLSPLWLCFRVCWNKMSNIKTVEVWLSMWLCCRDPKNPVSRLLTHWAPVAPSL